MVRLLIGLLLAVMCIYQRAGAFSVGRAIRKFEWHSITTISGAAQYRSRPCTRITSTALAARWGNYKSDGKKEGKVLFIVISLLVLRGAFVPKDLRTTTACPTGYGAEKTLARFKANDSSYHCLPTGDLVKNYFTSRWVFPGDPDFDPNFLRIEMRGVKEGGVSFTGGPAD